MGKTTTSCSLAVQLSEVRESVLIISTDPAHNLSDAFRQKFTRHPTLVDGFDNLYAMEVDPEPEDAHLANGEEDDGFLADLTSSIPGIDEAMSFAEVMKQVQTMDYSAIVFDTAPTGHTLRLLQFPTVLEKGLNKILSLKSMMGGMMAQLAKMMGGQEEGEDEMITKMAELKTVVEKVNVQFKDPEMTTFVCVCIPEFLSLYETERLVQELAKFEIDTHNIVINQVLFPERAGGSKLLGSRIKMQQKYLDQFYDLYEDFHIVKMPLLEEEVRGVEALRSFSNSLVNPYKPPPAPEMEDEVSKLQQKIIELEAEIRALKA